MKCTLCLLDKNESDFSLKNSLTGKRHCRCKSCFNLTRLKYHESYKARGLHKVATQKSRVKGRTFLEESKKGKPCMDCGGIFHVAAMEYDHVGEDKIDHVSRMIDSIPKMRREIAKCELVCANCHRVRTFNRRIAQPG